LPTTYTFSCVEATGTLSDAICGVGVLRDHNKKVQMSDKAGGQAFMGGTAGGGFLYHDHDPSSATEVTITTIYGVDLTPGLGDDDFIMGGVDAVTPQFVIDSDTYIGQSQDYDATFLGAFPVGTLGLAPQFAGFDLSRFGGDPSGLVYAFRATVPIADVFQAVPEPGSVGLLLLGLSAVVISRRR
jgi:hypothetical protein